jgi:tetratricopeptide (TPR) repeat protein
LSHLTLESQASGAIEFGNTLYLQGKYEAAIKYYQKFLASQTGDVELYFNFSQCLRNLKKIKEAIALLRNLVATCKLPLF